MSTYIGKIDIDGVVMPVGSTLYGTCETLDSVAQKVVVLPNFDELLTGVTIHVKFSHTNSASNASLNVNGTGSKLIDRYGSISPGNTEDTSWQDDSVVSFTYDGTYWIINNWNSSGKEYVYDSSACSITI